MTVSHTLHPKKPYAAHIKGSILDKGTYLQSLDFRTEGKQQGVAAVLYDEGPREETAQNQHLFNSILSLAMEMITST